MTSFHAPWEWTSAGADVANHLWQSSVFIVLCWLATVLLRKNSARVRHWIWLAASLKLLLPLSVFVGLGTYLGAAAEIRIAQPSWQRLKGVSEPFDALGSTIAAESVRVPAVESSRTPVTPWVLLSVWLLGSVSVALL